MRPPIHIVGGGIGGLTAAVALRARGMDVHVHEAAASYRDVGGGHWLYANALHALQRIDPSLKDDMVALGKGFDGFRFRTHEGRLLLAESTRPFTPRPDLAPVVLRRADIIDVLARRIPADRLHFGRRLARCEGQRLHFEDGTCIEAPLIVGADGIHSVVRRDRLGGSGAQFSGQTGLWGISDARLPADTGRYFTELWADGLRMGFTYVGTGGVYWFMVVRDLTVPEDPQARKDFILDRASIFPPELVQAVRTTEASKIHINPLYDMIPPRRWSAEGVVCLGDAVHPCTPNLGQGGCQAIEDGVWLSRCLDQDISATEAFARFQRGRRVKTTAVVLLSRWLGRLAQSGGMIRPVRNGLVRVVPAAWLRPLLRWIMGAPG